MDPDRSSSYGFVQWKRTLAIMLVVLMVAVVATPLANADQDVGQSPLSPPPVCNSSQPPNTSMQSGGSPIVFSSTTIVINEICTLVDWVELYNYGPAQDMTGWTLYADEFPIQGGIAYIFPAGFMLPSSGFVVIHDNWGADDLDDLYTGTNIFWNTPPESPSMVSITNSGGTVVDYVEWSAGGTPYGGAFPTEPWTGTLIQGAGQEILYRMSDVDTDDASDWSIGTEAGVPATPQVLNPGQTGSIIAIGPPTQTRFGWRGDYVDHYITIRNTGTVSDVFLPMFGDFEWRVKFWNLDRDGNKDEETWWIGPVPPGGTMDFIAEVRVPNVSPGDMDQVPITITSNNDRTFQRTVQIITRTSLPTPFLDDFEIAGASGNFGQWASDGMLHSTDPGGPAYSPIPIPGGTPIFLSDDEVSGLIPMGFTFDFYYGSYTGLYVSSNGFVTFNNDGDDGCCSGDWLPDTDTPNNLIAFWWEDLDPSEGGSISYDTVGTVPNRIFVLEFDNIQHCGGGAPCTMQMQLFEGTNIIEIHYISAVSDGGVHTVGVENSDGTRATTYLNAFTDPPAEVGTALQFNPPTVVHDVWTRNDANLVGVSDQTAVPPSTWSMYTRGIASSTSCYMHMDGIPRGIASCWIQRGGGFSEVPDSGEDLVIEYADNRGNWYELGSFPGAGTPGEIFTPIYQLPSNALHPRFQLRFRQLGGNEPNGDYWHIDNVYIGPPGPNFDLLPNDSREYEMSHSTNPGGPVFAPITIAGTPIVLSDDAVSGFIPMDFTFNFYENFYTGLYVSSNGFITFNSGGDDGCCSGDWLPDTDTPNNLIAFWWEDINPDSGGTITYGTVGIAPNRVFIVEFNNVPHYDNNNPITVQTQLFEGTDIIEIHFINCPSDGGVHTVGVENSDGTRATTYLNAFTDPPAEVGTALRFTPGSSFAISRGSDPGNMVHYNMRIENNCHYSDTYLVTAQGSWPTTFAHESQPTFGDNFNDGNYNDWTVVDEGTSDAPSGWSVDVGRLNQTGNIHTWDDPEWSGTYLYYNGGLGWTDYAYQTRIYPMDNDGFGVMFRYTDNDNYYRFRWMTNEDGWDYVETVPGFQWRALDVCIDGAWHLLAWDDVPAIKNQWYDFEARCIGERIETYIDGNLIFDVIDHAHNQGTIALYTWCQDATYFDDVSIYGSLGANSLILGPVPPGGTIDFIAFVNTPASALPGVVGINTVTAESIYSPGNPIDVSTLETTIWPIDNVHNLNKDAWHGTIQDGVSMANSRDRLFAYSNTYNENVVIDRPLTITGEDQATTIIDGGGSGAVVAVTSNYVDINGFTMQNSGDVFPDAGIALVAADGCNIHDNTFKQCLFGTTMATSVGNQIRNNIMVNNFIGFVMQDSADSLITDNLMMNNQIGGALIDSSGPIIVYHNDFIDNTMFQALDNTGGNFWDNLYPSGGNYWSDYPGVDMFSGPVTPQILPGSDGIGDTPYPIQDILGPPLAWDNYPFMNRQTPLSSSPIDTPFNTMTVDEISAFWPALGAAIQDYLDSISVTEEPPETEPQEDVGDVDVAERVSSPPSHHSVETVPEPTMETEPEPATTETSEVEQEEIILESEDQTQETNPAQTVQDETPVTQSKDSGSPLGLFLFPIFIIVAVPSVYRYRKRKRF